VLHQRITRNIINLDIIDSPAKTLSTHHLGSRWLVSSRRQNWRFSANHRGNTNRARLKPSKIGKTGTSLSVPRIRTLPDALAMVPSRTVYLALLLWTSKARGRGQQSWGDDVGELGRTAVRGNCGTLISLGFAPSRKIQKIRLTLGRVQNFGHETGAAASMLRAY